MNNTREMRNQWIINRYQAVLRGKSWKEWRKVLWVDANLEVWVGESPSQAAKRNQSQYRSYRRVAGLPPRWTSKIILRDIYAWYRED